jgi:hypothetical protein
MVPQWLSEGWNAGENSSSVHPPEKPRRKERPMIQPQSEAQSLKTLWCWCKSAFKAEESGMWWPWLISWKTHHSRSIQAWDLSSSLHPGPQSHIQGGISIFSGIFSANLFWKHPHRHTQKYACQFSRDPSIQSSWQVRLTTKIMEILTIFCKSFGRLQRIQKKCFPLIYANWI